MNNYIFLLILSWKININILIYKNLYVILQYISQYISKSESKSEIYWNIFAIIASYFSKPNFILSFTTKIMNILSVKQEWLA